MSAKTFTKSQLADLAKNPHNVVYECANRAPVAKPISLDKVEQQALNVWQRFQDLRADRELTDAEFNTIKSQLDVEFAALEHSHPNLYARIVDRKTTQAHFDALMFIIKAQKEDPSDAGRERVAQKLKEQFPILK